MHFLCFPHSKYFFFIRFFSGVKKSRLLVFFPTNISVGEKNGIRSRILSAVWFLVKSSKRLPKSHVLACFVCSDSSACFFRKSTGPKTQEKVILKKSEQQKKLSEQDKRREDKNCTISQARI